jgi:hypothetical protein
VVECRTVILKEKRSIKELLGKKPENAIYSEPKDCIIGPATRVSFAENIQITKLDENYYSYRIGNEVYIYRKDFHEMLNFLLDYFRTYGKFPTRGMLLYGPPGNGKTTFARVASSFTGADLEIVDISALLDKFVGETEKNVVRFFERLKSERNPRVVLIDEIDSVATNRDKRSEMRGESSAEYNMLTLMLQKITELPPTVIIIGATNVDKSLIDPALLRPGRLDEQIFVPNPSMEQIKWYIKVAYPEFAHEAEKMALELASMGANFAEVRKYLEMKRIGKQYKPEKNYRGYEMFVMPPINMNVSIPEFESLKYVARGMIYYVKCTSPLICIPLLGYTFLKNDRTPVIIYNIKGLEEGIKTAESFGKDHAVIIIDARSGITEDKVMKQTEVPVVFVSEKNQSYIEKMKFTTTEVQLLYTLYGISSTKYVTEPEKLERIIKHCKDMGSRSDECIMRFGVTQERY